jgi:hypothetical protein
LKILDFQEFVQSLERDKPPVTTNQLLSALWQDAKGNWSSAHSIAQEVDGPMGYRVHAYLHRKEGDLSNAGYWYNRAGKARPDVDTKTEWEQLVRALI